LTARSESSGAAGSRLPRYLALAGVVAVVALLAYGLFTQGASTRIDDSLRNGDPAPAPGFELEVLEAGRPPAALDRELRPDLADGKLAFTELSGIPFVLNFWASWCAPCRDEAPVLQRGWERHGPDGILYLGLNMQDVSDDARAFLDEFGITYPTIREPDKEIATAYGATGIPETDFASGEGEVVAHVIGVVSDEQLDAGIRAAMAGEVLGSLSGGASKPQR
jgi:cytochrome c biogenesis protein CcmG/thiol:disulfide interchange protein DsbE